MARYPDDVATGRRGDISAPITASAVVTPDDTAEITFTPASGAAIYPRCLWIGTGGDLTVDLVEGGTDIVYKNVPAGRTFSRRVKRVKTATTAADIVAEW